MAGMAAAVGDAGDFATSYALLTLTQQLASLESEISTLRAASSTAPPAATAPAGSPLSAAHAPRPRW